MAEKDWRGIALGLDEYNVVPELARKTRQNKALIKTNCKSIVSLATQFERDVSRIPELDDEKHAALVETVVRATRSALYQLDRILALSDSSSAEYQDWEDWYYHG